MVKSWFTSKLIWLGILETLVASLSLVAEFIQKNTVDASSFIMLATGILTIVIRKWFTNTAIG